MYGLVWDTTLKLSSNPEKGHRFKEIECFGTIKSNSTQELQTIPKIKKQSTMNRETTVGLNVLLWNLKVTRGI